MENITKEDIERYKNRIASAQSDYQIHMTNAPAAAHNRDTNEAWQRWIAGMKRLGNKVIDAQIAYVKALSTLKG